MRIFTCRALRDRPGLFLKVIGEDNKLLVWLWFYCSKRPLVVLFFNGQGQVLLRCILLPPTIFEMPRPASLKLDTDSVGPNELAYELDNSPPISLYSEYDEDTKHDLHDSYDDEKHPIPSTPATSTNPTRQQPAPSLRLLFSLLSSHHRTWLLLPAILASLISGGIAPFMTVAIGQVFNAFALFHNSVGTEADKQKILHDTGIGSLELVGLAIGSIALGSVTSGLWISTGEHNVMNLRKYVYTAVTSKDLTWFDTKMGTEGESSEMENSDGPAGAGGLMAKFSRCVPSYPMFILH